MSRKGGLRRAVKARGHFPTEQAAMKCLYMALMSLDPGGKGRYLDVSVMPMMHVQGGLARKFPVARSA